MTRHLVSTRHVVSTHWLRRTARSAKRHYERLQVEAFATAEEWNPGEALEACKRLGIGESTQLTVERAYHERAKWRVIAVG